MISKKVGIGILIGLILIVSSSSVWAAGVGIMSHAEEVVDKKVYHQVKYTGQLFWVTTSTHTYYKSLTFNNGYNYTTKTTYTEPVFHATDMFGNGYFTRYKIVTYIYKTY
ncbi:hypothetical protein Y919_06325 [Caloranaerobacter azorensis H53214]|uniref:Uncharacterized protein n=1 Tax=Caloranaerobacter azorensis H53214 TaxID=1156417 RepID=A0A096BI23_9FIRM|nr:hypothetical protein [Caloranaerobacter azorensis]KGG80428.1 hypothetical protein Y919_06325 [Caloranaerobacter azorensis H53214]